MSPKPFANHILLKKKVNVKKKNQNKNQIQMKSIFKYFQMLFSYFFQKIFFYAFIYYIPFDLIELTTD